ncbi:transcriptional regulator FtsR [Actinomarinicola tropica]|uniref:MerR family DNA-binding transcriptional regulator n=1 Tax=Actinomarinicola tropica TaxID=2789776 RepID=A0A5Q2RLE9_9ACTN|nr:MerR family transcriptional regulator [Actinomarinicola tropica]QGG95256.1 MerR family DNA-binding transcriptional regulator [Actinomarinicola tropica]
MSEAPSERTRAHLSIGEVLSLLQGEFPDITISKIRFLESQGLLDPERTPSGYRKFYDGDIRRLRWILHQQRDNFLPLKVIKERLESGDVDDPPEEAGPTPGGAEADGPTGELDLPEPPPSTPTAPAPAAASEPTPERPRPRATSGTTDAGRGAARAAREAVRSAPLDPNPASVALSREELAEAAGITVEQVADLERFGLLTGRSIGPTTLFDESALDVARLASGFIRHGVEGRHLRMYRVAAEREASFFQQVVMPQLKQRHPAARQQAIETLGELAELGEGLRAAMLHHALRDYLGPT